MLYSINVVPNDTVCINLNRTHLSSRHYDKFDEICEQIEDWLFRNYDIDYDYDIEYNDDDGMNISSTSQLANIVSFLVGHRANFYKDQMNFFGNWNET